MDASTIIDITGAHSTFDAGCMCSPANILFAKIVLKKLTRSTGVVHNQVNN